MIEDRLPPRPGEDTPPRPLPLHDDPRALDLLSWPYGGHALGLWALGRSWLESHPDYGWLLPGTVARTLALIVFAGPRDDPNVPDGLLSPEWLVEALLTSGLWMRDGEDFWSEFYTAGQP